MGCPPPQFSGAFGASVGGSLNPFVWLLEGIKEGYRRFSQTKLGQVINRFFATINQFLKAKIPHEAPTKSDVPAKVEANPAQKAQAPSNEKTQQAIELKTPTEKTPTDPLSPHPSRLEPSAEKLETTTPEPIVDNQSHTPPPPQLNRSNEPTVPAVVAPPPLVTSGPQPKLSPSPAKASRRIADHELTLERLQKKKARYVRLEQQCAHRQNALQKQLAKLQTLRQNEVTKNKKPLYQFALDQEHEHLISAFQQARQKAIAELDARIKSIQSRLEYLNQKQSDIRQRMPILDYWLVFRQRLAQS